MKKFIIVVLVVVLAVGGWLIYDKTKSSSTTSSNGSLTSPSVKGKVVDKSNQGLTRVDASIYNQTDAVELNLAGNNLTSLPSEMGKMTSLQVLKLDHNQLEGSLIAEVRKMPLVALDVSYNKMTGMPAEIGQLNKLQTLNYSYNNIDSLPNELLNLKQLKQLDLTGNPLSAAKIAQLRAGLPNTNIIF